MTNRQMIGYAMGDLGINLYFILVMTYLLYFYTDVLGISATAAAGVFGVARVIDAVTDPIMGLLAERTRSRYGRMRPYILFGALPLGLITILCFWVPPLAEPGKILWAYLTYILFSLLFTLVSIPYSTLSASLTGDYAERTKLSTWRMAAAFAGGLLVSSGTPLFVQGFADKGDGYFSLAVIFGLVATLLLWITFASTKEVIQPPLTQKLSLHDSANAVLLNPPLLWVMGIFCCSMLSFTVRQAVAIYYFNYYLQAPAQLSLYFAITIGVMLLGLLLVPYLADRVGKTGALLAGAWLTIAASIGFYFNSPSNIVGVYIWGSLVALGATPVAVLGWAMIPDTVEYAQWKLGYRADGAIFSVASFFQKLAKALGGAGLALALGAVGYVANQPQSEATLTALHAILTLTPVGLMLILMVCARNYGLDRNTHARIRLSLDAGMTSSASVEVAPQE